MPAILIGIIDKKHGIKWTVRGGVRMDLEISEADRAR
jgi:hypothetical protein